MMKWFSLFFVISINTSAQENKHYKTIYENNLAIRTSVIGNILSLDIGNLTYLPNNKNSLYFGISHPKFPFEIGYGFDFGSTKNPNLPRTKKLDLQLHLYKKKYVLDLSFQDYKEFYCNTDLALPKVNHTNLSILMISALGQYIFNNNKFSYAASFGNREKQLKTAGTFLVGIQAYYLRLKSKREIIKNKKELKLFGLNGGYAINHPFHNNWITNLSCNIGLNLTDNFSLKYSALARVSLFHIGEKVTWGFSGIINNLHLKNIDEKELTKINSGQVNIDFIYYFKLKKKK